jgi:hypothetical protein
MVSMMPRHRRGLAAPGPDGRGMRGVPTRGQEATTRPSAPGFDNDNLPAATGTLPTRGVLDEQAPRP